ncbi:peptidylprolyl isomerase [Rhodopirellula sp. MGV]|uniref:peptidylprolyl isomerase n=1 Tax=Rhodopirellula sp. MGV TaxID=2023130 RepID=UPI000B96C2AB|nr:peptidylprolyl isomerase [Rhodopirellula sp. MGV]OYP33804.1 hypothetical protein CGZ80_17825 [Rhodopirellula sp. MGV]PNY37534.1 hypothetical protein C2E31_07320 [Rhodopirellula baltica]
MITFLRPKTFSQQIAAATVWLLLLGCSQPLCAQPNSGLPTDPGEPFVTIDGQPILIGELNYVLRSKLKTDRVSGLPLPVKQATANLLLRQHLALRCLKSQGGEKLQRLIDRYWDAYVDSIRRGGESIDSICKRYECTESALRAAKAWEIGWREYLRSKMNDANLAKFYASNRERFTPTSWKVSHFVMSLEDEDQLRSVWNELTQFKDQPDELREQFVAMTEKHSKGSTASEGGLIGWVSASGDLPEAVMRAIARTEPGQITYPVRSPLGFHFVLVHEREQKPVPFESLSDRSQLRREAADYLFNLLVKSGAEQAKITWYVSSLQTEIAQLTQAFDEE